MEIDSIHSLPTNIPMLQGRAPVAEAAAGAGLRNMDAADAGLRQRAAPQRTGVSMRGTNEFAGRTGLEGMDQAELMRKAQILSQGLGAIGLQFPSTCTTHSSLHLIPY